MSLTRTLNSSDMHDTIETLAGLVAQQNSSIRITVTDCSDPGEGYNQGLAVASIFVIFAVSFAGFIAPVWCSTRSHPALSILVAAMAFVGTAILLTVGFIHILGDAAVDLASPCLPAGFLKAYPSWALLVCVCTIIGMMILDWLAKGHIEKVSASTAAATEALAEESTTKSDGSECEHALAAGDVAGCGQAAADAVAAALESGHRTSSADLKHALGHCSAKAMRSLKAKRAVVAIVEFSVCTHSVPVGLDLGLQPASTFVGLFVAIIFHQVLEGLGVGAAVADAQFPLRTAVFLALGFAATCPLGIALGIGLHDSLNPRSSTYLLLLGFVNAVASGMLIYTAFEHMNAFASRGAWLRRQSWRVQALCLLAFLAASAGMLIVGKWA